MRIISLHIEEFGALENRDFTFAPGINILEGRNESGKSTLSAFIRFIFYGIPGRTAGEAVSERTRRLNWRTGRASGSMIVSTDADDHRYRIQRTLVRTLSGSAEASRESYTESLQIVDLESGTPLPRGTQPGEYFLGVPAAVFESTAFVRQLGCTGVDGAGVSEALENLLTSANETSNTARALARLDSARKALLHKNGRGGEIFTLQNERSTVASRLAQAKEKNSARIAAQNLHEDLKRSGAASKEKLDQLNARCEAYDALQLLRRFESLHALEKKTAELRTALGELYAAEGTETFFPNRAYAAQLRDLERRIAAAEADHARTETELARMRGEQPGDRVRAAQAAEIRTAGGVDILTEQYAHLTRRSKTLNTLAVIFFILAALCLGGGIALGYFLPAVGYLPALSCLPVLAGAILCLVLARRRKDNRRDLCCQYGMDEDLGEGAFADYLSSCFTEEEQFKGYEEILAQIEDELSRRQQSLDLLRGEAIDALAKWDIPVVDGGLTAALSAAIPRAERAADSADELMHDLRKYEDVLQNKAEELADEDESLLRRRVAASPADTAEINISVLRREREFCAKGLESIEYKRIETEKQLIALEAVTEDPIKLAAKLEELDRRIEELTARHDAIRLAAESLEEAAESMRRGVIPRLRRRAGELLSRITDGRYSGIGLGHGMAMTVETADAARPVELLSSGTGDAAYLALRLALLDLLYPNERPPILLDESLAQLDNTRAAALLAMLKESTGENGQCLLFTCHPREAQMVEAEHILLG